MPNQKLNIIFAGTPDFAANILQDLLSYPEYNISAIYTQPDRPAGRGMKLSHSAVKKLIIESNVNIPIEQPDNFKLSNPEYNHYISQLAAYNPDLLIVVAYGLILPKSILEIPKYGCINIHASLLPRWRGAAPIQRAILAGDIESGIAIQQMDTGLDTGDIIAEAKCNIINTDTALTLSDKLLKLAKPLLQKVLQNFSNNDIPYIKQDNSLATYAHKLEKSESFLDLHDDAIILDRKIRAFNPWPGTQINLKNNITLKIWDAEIIKQQGTLHKPGTVITADRSGIVIQCGKNQLKIKKLQFSGSKVISAQDALNCKYKDLFSLNMQIIN
jgi:methionyl-tRNA formyltransferase